MAIHNVLLLIDFQEGFLREGSQFLRSKVQSLVLEPRFDSVIATRFLNRPGSLWNTVIGWNGLMLPKDQEIVVDLPPFATVIDKNTYGLSHHDLTQFVKRFQDSNVFLAGIETDVCVTIIAAQLFDLGIAPYILAPYTASNRGLEHTEHAFLTLGRVVGSSHILKSLDDVPLHESK